MLKNYPRTLVSLSTAAAATLLLAGAAAAAEPQPFLLKSDGQQFALVKNWTFGNQRPEATVRNKAELDQDFYYRYIWENGKLDKFKTYWSYHRDYPGGDPKSLHVFGDRVLVLKGRIPPGGGLHERGIESGLLRGKIPVTPGMYIEMRAKLTGGVGVWPNFWLEEGVQNPDGTFSAPPKALPEIDIFEFFNWDGRPQTRILTGNVQTFGGAAAYGHPHDIFTTFANAGYEKHLDLGFDCSKDFHVFALDWVENQPIWLLDGRPIKQTYYEWHGPPAHLVVANSIGMNLPGVKQTQMVADEKQWDYTIDYIRIWERKAGAIEIPAGPVQSARPTNPLAVNVAAVAEPKPEPKATTDGPIPYPSNDHDWPGKGPIRSFGFMVGERKAFWKNREKDQGAVVFVGDSLTGGWKTLAQDFPKLKVANRGVGGDVSRGVLFRLKEDVLDLNPKAVVIEIGNNDLTATGAPADMLSNLADMVALVEKEKPGMPVVLCTIPPSANPKAPVKPESRKAMNEGIRKIAAEHKNTHFCDLYPAVADADGSPKPEYFAADKLHLSDAGHAKWAELLTPIFEKLKLE